MLDSPSTIRLAAETLADPDASAFELRRLAICSAGAIWRFARSTGQNADRFIAAEYVRTPRRWAYW